jgi:predicted GIY-YIG superfamily endonuclease
MSPQFQALVAPLHDKFERLRNVDPYGNGIALPNKGIYLFRENGKDLYVGRSNNILRRYRNHTRGKTNQAAFAMRLACEKLNLKRTYMPGAEERASNPKFLEAFNAAKERIRAMEFRAVEECNQTQQALLEIYCAITLETPYNNFGTS